MFGLDSLDVGIGMALMFLFVSLICSAIREFGESLLKTRGDTLERGIREMLGEAAGSRDAAEVTRKLYNHPMVAALYDGTFDDARPAGRRNKLPSYIPAENFALAILQIARDHPPPPGSALGIALRTTQAAAGNDLSKLQGGLERWFNSTMDRISGWYTRRTQYWLFFLGLGCAILMNVDAITVMKTLSTDKKLRETVVAAAGDALAKCEKNEKGCPTNQISGPARDDVSTATPGKATAPGLPAHSVAATDAATAGQASQSASVAASAATSAAVPDAANDDQIADKINHFRRVTAQMNEVNWPIGWDQDWLPAPQNRVFLSSHPGQRACWIDWFLHNPLVLVGWLVTAFGVTFGASFWFDVLNKFMIVRSTVKPDEKSPKEGSKS
jgi:hypothetical protein